MLNNFTYTTREDIELDNVTKTTTGRKDIVTDDIENSAKGKKATVLYNNNIIILSVLLERLST